MILIICMTCFKLVSMTQKELVHVKTTLIQVHGGVEGSGISSTTMYTFVANKKIKLTNILMADQSLELRKGDTIVYKIDGIDPLGAKSDISQADTINPTKIFTATFSDNKYFVYLKQQWNAVYSRQYQYKRKKFVAGLQDVVIENKVYYAP